MRLDRAIGADRAWARYDRDVTEVSVFRPGDVSYLRIAAPDIARSAAFYRTVFGWETDADRGRFADATGHVIGHFMTDLPVVGEAGVVP